MADTYDDTTDAAHDCAWKDAILNACIVDWIFTNEHETHPRKAVNDLLCWQQKLALDPAVSEDAAKLHAQRCDFPEHLELLAHLAAAQATTLELRLHAHELDAEIEWLRALVDAVGEDVCKTALRMKARDHDQSPDK